MATQYGDCTPAKSTLLLLFAAACHRLENCSESLARLSSQRIASATEDLRQLADEIRDESERRAMEDADYVRGRVEMCKPRQPLGA